MITGNEPAMPTETYFNGEKGTYCYSKQNADLDGKEYGLTIRQHFAAMAMQGLLANNEHNHPDLKGLDERAGVAAYSIQMADALIAELNKEK